MQGSACPYALDILANRFDKPESYAEHSDILERLRLPISKLFKLNEDAKNSLTFYDLIGYTDALVARRFEGLNYGDPKYFSMENLND